MALHDRDQDDPAHTRYKRVNRYFTTTCGDKHSWILERGEQLPSSDTYAVHETCLYCPARRTVYK